MSESRELVAVKSSLALRSGFENWADVGSLRKSVRGPARYGLALTGLFVFGFCSWAGTVNLAGGAIAPGVISPEGSRKTVQHLEGGIIAKLHVTDGDVVAKGQPLVELESLQPRANHDMLRSQERALSLTKLRLEAERAGATEFPLPANLSLDEPATARIFTGQLELLTARLEAHLVRKKVTNQRIEQLQKQIIGFEAQVESVGRQLELIADELQGKRQLYQQGLLPKPVLRQIERAEADLVGRRGEYKASIARAQEQIGEAKLQDLRLEAERLDDISTQLEKVQLDLMTTEERLHASADVLARTVITAPVAGKIVNLLYKAERGVVQPGAPIMDIVPAEDTLLIDARVSPNDIDIVHVGLKAQVQLTAYSSRRTPRVAGVVRTVSADRLVDEATRQAYFLARVEVYRSSLVEAGSGVEMVPGMPADVLIMTGERTLAQYFMQPFFDALWRAFREA
jgi:HlyD family secretion protein/epimerase transport system membrane fusion protein